MSTPLNWLGKKIPKCHIYSDTPQAITGVILGGLALITSVTVPAIADSPPRQTKTVILGLLVFLFGVLCGFIAITYSG